MNTGKFSLRATLPSRANIVSVDRCSPTPRECTMATFRLIACGRERGVEIFGLHSDKDSAVIRQ